MTLVTAVLLVFFLYLFAISREIRRQKWFYNGSVVLALGILVSAMFRVGGAEKSAISLSADGIELIVAAISLMIVVVGGRGQGKTDENAKTDVIEALGRMGESVE
jgi:peptidoglycan/LPS O-acetylase OafA/YrhL